MTDTTLPPEVAEAIKYVDGIFDDADNGEWSTVRTHLHRLAEENARLLAANKDSMLHYNDCRADLAKAESERDTLKARIAEAMAQQWGREEGLFAA